MKVIKKKPKKERPEHLIKIDKEVSKCLNLVVNSGLETDTELNVRCWRNMFYRKLRDINKTLDNKMEFTLINTPKQTIKIWREK